MKKLLFLLIALLSITMLQAGQSIVINGRITNCPNRENAFIRKCWFNPSVLEEQTNHTTFQIAEDGTFHVEIPDANEFYARYWITLGYEQTHMELIAGDSITMVLNADVFDESILYTGRGAGRNNYRRDIFLQFWENKSNNWIYSNDPSQFLSGLYNLRDRKLELLNKYFQSKEIDSSYYQYEKTLIMNETANWVLINNNTYHHHKNLSASLTRQMEDILKAADYSDERILNHKESRELIAGLPAYMQEIRPFDHVDVNREIAFAKAHYSSTMQQYATREIMRKYLEQGSNIGQRTAMLNFFDKQANAPALKDEIQQLRSSLHSNRIVNSRLFQAALIIILWLVGMILVIYTVIKLIQYLGTKRIRFKVSLWLKVVFYLAIAILAMGFIANNNEPFHGLPLLVLMLGTFLIHTYVLIPRYALNGNVPRYILFTAGALVIFVTGCLATRQVPPSMYAFLVLNEVFCALILLSWASYYTHQLASGKSTLKELKNKGDLNLEIAFNLVILFLINLIFIAGGQNHIRLSEGVIFYTLILIFYFHTLYTYPRFFNKEKVSHFIGINVLFIIVTAVLLIALDAVQSYWSLKSIGLGTKMPELISIQNIRPDLLLVFTLLLIPSFVYYYIKNQLAAMESTGFQLYRRKEAELAQLKSQVNPHFLFNTLNTLYAFALKEGSDKTAESIAKLANLMRFMLDDMEKETILLKREISYIQDYVKLQSIRSAVEHDIAINVEMEDEQSYSIAPMLLIPFVENAFKHGMNPGKVSQLRIDIKAKENQIQFVIENSLDEHFQAYYKEKGFGIGIENVKSRLRYAYPHRHTLSIAKTAARFIVILNIEV